MDAILQSLAVYPTVVFSVLLVAAVLYWLLVILGAVDLDLLHLGDHDAGGHDHDAGHGHNPLAILEFLRVGQVPLTIILSVFVFVAWSVCFFGTGLVRPLLPGWSWWLVGSLLLVAAVVTAFVATGLIMAPLAKVFSLDTQPKADDLIGKPVEITSSTVDARYGTARHDRPSGEDLILNVTCEPHHQLKKGDAAVVLEYDRQTGVYRVAPLPHTRPGFLDGMPAETPAQQP